jgi:1-acyl-sn-glycerol-3-phosphate acyltransferase
MVIVRALIFNAFFFSVTPLFALLGTLLRVAGCERSLQTAQLWAKLMVLAAQRLCGIYVVLTGDENLPREGAALLACQHQSAFDTLVWLTLTSRPSYVVKQELTRIPLFGPMLHPAGMIAVDRATGAAAMRGLLTAASAAKADGRQIVIFPEGTRVAPGERVKLKSGFAAIAARLNLPVIPVATDSGRRWGRRSFLKTPGPIHIAVGTPLPPGTPRAELLTRVEAFWRQQEAVGYQPVGKSVECFQPEAEETLNAAPQPH